MAFKEQFRSVDVLMIDDVQFIGGREATQEEFFHTFNALVDQNRQVVISADKSPSDLEGVEERMRSRLGWGLVADIHPTTYELRLGILQAKAEQFETAVPEKVLEFLAHKITSNVRELEGALNRIMAHATLVGRPITLETTQEVLHDLLRANDRRVTIEEIQKKVSEHFNVRVADMHSARRARAVARPRQVAMYLSKQLTARSLPEIGRKFGGRDHTTVMHAVKKVEELKATDSTFGEDRRDSRRAARRHVQYRKQGPGGANLGYLRFHPSLICRDAEGAENVLKAYVFGDSCYTAIPYRKVISKAFRKATRLEPEGTGFGVL
jgi:chromosomal replication initiator protein